MVETRLRLANSVFSYTKENHPAQHAIRHERTASDLKKREFARTRITKEQEHLLGYYYGNYLRPV